MSAQTFNVRDYGAIGDGVTDDRAAIQAAINAAYRSAAPLSLGGALPVDLAARLKSFNPRTELGQYVKTCVRYLPPEMARELIERAAKTVVVETAVHAAIIRSPHNRVPAKLLSAEAGRARDALYKLHGQRDHALRQHNMLRADRLLLDIEGFSRQCGLWEDMGLVGQKVVTTAGVNFLVDAWQNITELENLKFHAIGTGSTAEAIGDTALVTELTTQYNPDSTRATGSLTEGGTSNVFRTVGTNTVDATVTIAEHGLLSQAATGGGTLWDRTVLSPTSGLNSGDSLQTTYDLTATAGG